MKDRRVLTFSKSLEDLVESLDSTLRLARWDGTEVAPEPLRDSASKLVARLGVTDRMAAGVFKGSVADVAKVNALTDQMRRLGTAYVNYRKRLEAGPHELGKAADELSAALEQVRAENMTAS